MKAMVLCAGLGTRLGPLTQNIPKPLLQAGGHPILSFILQNLKLHRVQDVVINLHFGGEQIRSAFGSGEAEGLNIFYSEEPALLGTAGAVKRVSEQFLEEEAFLVHYGDVVTTEDLSAMRDSHLKQNALLTMLVHHRRRSNSALEIDENRRVLNFHERPPDSFWETTESAWVNSGVMIMSPEVLSYIPENSYSDWPRDIFPKLLPKGRVFAHPLTGYRIAVDSPERLQQWRRDMESGSFTGCPLRQLQ